MSPTFSSYKISFCTVCMNRLMHLKQTLKKNIEDNKDYGNVEFVLLDYNSTDGLEEWVKTSMKRYIKQGVLVYYKTNEPIFFNRSHSRNMMFKLASGDIICNIDADNFTGKGFAQYINEKFIENDNILLVADTRVKFYYLRDAVGRFCSKREDFLKITGYDEQMTSYGSEDIDLYKRILSLGRERAIIENTDFLKSIPHGDEERTKNESMKKNLKNVYVNYISAWKSELILLYKNNAFEKGTLVPNKHKSFLPISIQEGKWLTGQWQLNEQELVLTHENGAVETFTSTNKGKTFVATAGETTPSVFYKNTIKMFLFEILILHPAITNQEKHMKNLKEKKIYVNTSAFGQGVVYKNFDYAQPVHVS
jgi:glycosyltransferase involved in cell wall biosynthesis